MKTTQHHTVTTYPFTTTTSEVLLFLQPFEEPVVVHQCENQLKAINMADDEEVPDAAEAEAEEQVELSVLDALKVVSYGALHLINGCHTARNCCSIPKVCA